MPGRNPSDGGAPDAAVTATPLEARALAQSLGVTQAAVHIAFSKARERWAEHPHLPALHAALERALDRAGGVAPLARVAAELTGTEIPHRATPALSPPAAGRDGSAEALARIAVETHADIVAGRLHDVVWTATGAAPLALARELGRRADELARREPLPSSEEVYDALVAVVKDTALSALAHDRLVALAAEASVNAVRSARLELYPRGLEARRALALSASAVSPYLTTPEAIRQMVRARYPEAELPPEGEALHALMELLQFKWDATTASYTRPGADQLTAPQTQMGLRRDTTHTSHRPPLNQESQEAQEFEARLRLAVDKRSFRVLDVTAGFDKDAADELARRFHARVVSLDGEVISEIDRLAAETGVDPALIEETDRQGPTSDDDWANLCRMVREAAGRALERALASEPGASPRPLVLTQPGILARYRLDDVLGNLVQHGQRDDAPAIFLVNPTDDASEWARIDSGTKPLVVPLPSQAQRLKVPRPWIENIHRGGMG